MQPLQVAVTAALVAHLALVAQALPMLAEVVVLDGLLLAAQMVAAARAAAQLQAQQIQQILEHQILVVAALAIPTAQTTLPPDTLAATAVQELSLFGTPTLLPTLQALAVD